MQYFTEDFNPREYDGIADITGNKQTTLMAHNRTGKRIVRKQIGGINEGLYKQLTQIRHDNLIRVLGLETTAEGCYTYEEYIEGKTLAEILAGGPIPEKTAVQWIEQVCSAVKALHKQAPAIIHRDIKPSNVMLSSLGVIKLIDFDAAKELSSRKQRDTELIGTPDYAAPEQYGFAPSNPRTDIFAIGVLFQELLTGHRPSEGKAPYKGRYRAVIQNCTALDPKRRYRNVRVLTRQLGLRGIGRLTRHIPGFRTGKWWKTWIALTAYTVVLLAVTSLVFEALERSAQGPRLSGTFVSVADSSKALRFEDNRVSLYEAGLQTGGCSFTESLRTSTGQFLLTIRFEPGEPSVVYYYLDQNKEVIYETMPEKTQEGVMMYMGEAVFVKE